MMKPSSFSPEANPAVKKGLTSKNKPTGVASTMLAQLRASRRPYVPISLEARNPRNDIPTQEPTILDGVERRLEDKMATLDPRQSVISPRCRAHNSLRDPYQIPSDSEIDDSPVRNSTPKLSAIRRSRERTPSNKNASARSLCTAPRVNTQVHTTPTASRAGPGQASAQRSLLRTPSWVPADTQVISLNSSSSNETRPPRTTPPFTSTRSSTTHPRTTVKVPAGAKVISLLESSSNETLPAPTASQRGPATTDTPVLHRRTPAQIPVDAKIISLVATSSQSDDDDESDAGKLAVPMHSFMKTTKGRSHPSTTRHPNMMREHDVNGFQEPPDPPVIKVERKPWWNPWDWARRYGGTEFEINGPTVWFSDGPFKGYIINGPREGSYIPGYQAPNDEVLAQVEKTAVLEEAHELWDTSSESSTSQDTEQCNSMADAGQTTGESSPSELNSASHSLAALDDTSDNSRNPMEETPQATERDERIKRTQLYVLTGNPTNVSSWNTDNASLDSNESSMLPNNLAPASTPKRESPLLSTNSESTSVLIARQLTVQSSPPPSNQELAALMSSSPAPRQLRPSKVHMQEEQVNYEDVEWDQSSDEPSAGVPVRPHQVITPVRAREAICDTPQRFEKPSATHVGDNIAERRITRSMTRTPGSARPNYRVSGTENDVATEFAELPGDTPFKPPQGAPRLKQVDPNPKDKTDACSKADIVVEIPAMTPEQQAEYATVPSSETSSLDPLYIPKSFDELNGTCTSRSAESSSDSNEEALAFTLRESPSWLNSITQIDSTHVSDSTQATKSRPSRQFTSITGTSKRTCPSQERSSFSGGSNLDYMPRDERRSLMTDRTTKCTMEAAATGYSKKVEPKGFFANTTIHVSSSQSPRALEIKKRKSGTLKTVGRDGTAGAKHVQSGPIQPRVQSTTAVPLPPLFVAYTLAKTGNLPSELASGSQQAFKSPESLTNPISSPIIPGLIDRSSFHAVSSPKKRKLDEVVGSDMPLGACEDYKQSPRSIESRTKKRKQKHGQGSILCSVDAKGPSRAISEEHMKKREPIHDHEQRDSTKYKPNPTSGNSKGIVALCDNNEKIIEPPSNLKKRRGKKKRYKYQGFDARKKPGASSVDKTLSSIGLTSSSTITTPRFASRRTSPGLA